MIRVVTAPAAYPVTLTEAKDWARVDSIDTSQDTSLNMLIAAMTSYAEGITGRAFVQRTLELSLPAFKRTIELPWAPLIGVDSVSYTDTDEATQTVTSTEYEVDTVSQPGLIRPLSTKFWPSIGTRFNPVKIQYRAGYLPTGSPTDLTDNSYLPGQLRLWIQARICTLYDNREQLIVGATVAQIPRDFVDGLLDPLILGTRLF